MMSSEVNHGGLVKKLLFPGYDAGRNDTYLPTSGKAASVVSSEASTAVRDNRTTIASPPKVARSSSTTAVVVFPFDDETAARNPEDDEDRSNSTTKAMMMIASGEQEETTNPAANVEPHHSPVDFEEEATPEQTAFGKQLLFQRKLSDNQEDNDDALSTASESGTLIEQSAARLQDLDDMEDPQNILQLPKLDSPRSNLNQLLRSPKRSTNTIGPTAHTILSNAMRRIVASPRSSEASPTSSSDISKKKRTFGRHRINANVLPMRSCFSFDTIDATVPYYKPSRESASWDGGPTVIAQAFSTPTRIGPTHRLEMEREDAIDILSCLVERGVSFKPTYRVPNDDDTTTVKTNETGILELVQSLDVDEDRKACLEELVKSHEYALEMKRASKSAGVWLQSIGRQSPESKTTATKTKLEDTTTTQSTETVTSPEMDLVTVKALLHAAQREIKETKEQNERLNDELAQCRAEIGRLNTLNSQFRSNVNRSILDENDEDEDEVSDEKVLENDEGGTQHCLDTSFVRESTTIADFRVALQDANDIIAKLHAEKGLDEPAPIIAVPNIADAEESSPENSPSNKEERMINVRMLDAENFETDWDDMVPPLPTSPPEHDLRSPIVSAVLQSWTTDHGLHQSLLQWVEQILNTDEEVPPLTLSGLDHQVRDGFCLHILPLLLRKPDIHVNVQTRLQRRTTYDLAVTVEPTRPHVLDSSVATTAVMSNRAPMARLSYDEFVEPGIRSPDDDEPEQAGAWTSIGGALWGSLTSSRRKPNADVEEPYHRVVSAPPGRIGVTFVEYRGHCMVSDVAADSPLLNWVYPSDVLIAIDELPVSGMRVRDIIKVLKDRSERQRALRVVSSHSMSTLTDTH